MEYVTTPCLAPDTLSLYSYHLQLQKDTDWGDVKDFLREGDVDMDHVEIFPKSTSGWVRLYGRKNFDTAMSMSLRCVTPLDSRLTIA